MKKGRKKKANSLPCHEKRISIIMEHLNSFGVNLSRFGFERISDEKNLQDLDNTVSLIFIQEKGHQSYSECLKKMDSLFSNKLENKKRYLVLQLASVV